MTFTSMSHAHNLRLEKRKEKKVNKLEYNTFLRVQSIATVASEGIVERYLPYFINNSYVKHELNNSWTAKVREIPSCIMCPVKPKKA